MNSGSSAGGSSSSGFVGLNNGESGILRKTMGLGQNLPHHHPHHHLPYGQESFTDLLVFGYSCKVFRDDEKARFIDQGRHLIPWMGDNQLKIDRYDARGALHDLTQHEPPIGGYGNRLEYLPPAEQRAEQLCEDERYYSLYANEVEEEIYQEEAAKRLAASSVEIAFDYDAATTTEVADGTNAIVGPVPADPSMATDDENSSDPPFVAPSNFEIPQDLADLPETMKEHAIIEKTAKFIASQDSQMEILLRAKQAANPQFDFLSPGGRLYRYYRHVLMAIKTNRYPEDVPEEDSNGAAVEAPEDTVAEMSPEKPKVIVPTIKYKPSVDCAYTQLISKITGAPIPTKSDCRKSPVQTQLTALITEFEFQPEKKTVEVKKVPTGLAGLVQYDSDSDESASEVEEPVVEKKPDPTVERREITFSGLLPPEIFQHVIEKTATYVAKNGYSFEDALRTKNDPRFLFLRKEHEFYPYYAFRVRYLIDPFEEVPKSPETVTITREIENGTVVETPSIGIKTVNTAPQPVAPPVTQIQATKPGGAVCFSIKSKDDATKASKANVVQELGGNEEEAEPETEKEKSKSPLITGRDVEQPKDDSLQAGRQKETDGARTPSPPKVSVPQEIVRSSTPPPLEEAKPAPITDDGTRDLKRQEDRIKDKLAVAARERLAMIAKEKQLQLERKKRASMFISLISKQEVPETTENPTYPTENEWENSPPGTPPLLLPTRNGLGALKNEFEEEEEEDDDEPNNSSSVSIQSIPSQSASPASNQAPSSADDDVVLVEETVTKVHGNGRPSRSRTRSSSKHKKKKNKHKSKSKKSKKKKSKSPSPILSPIKSKTKTKRKRSRSRTPAMVPQRRRSRSHSEKEAKRRKKSKKKVHKPHKSSRSSSSSRHHHHKERRERAER
ncbi:protein suppressor of white apricot isoform X2 [Topomyia yanbarensis]|uniref:protein suppressor of white apricot isoform X2 n=1 Tax=Topomyia yanbarensis TaxID=2498891 RepID=UPI00273BDBD6|nr:protein suppressor of white apricot isoform X2 [Topomyia yanbarensis]